jgi:PAS domain S-box-containing protein
VSEEREHPVRIPSGESDSDREREIRFLRSVLELLPVGVFWKDRRGRYGGCNAAFLEYVGRSREDLVGRTVEEVHAEELARVYRSQDELLMREGRGVQIYRFVARRAASGELRDVDFYKAPFRDESGEVAGLVGAMVDVTDRVRAQEERLALAERAMENRRLESLGVLAAGIAHDLNNLLLCISGNLELALEEAAGREYLRERLLDALEATRRTADLTRQILISAEGAPSGRASSISGRSSDPSRGC